MTTSATFDEIKAKQHLTWSSGDYGRIAWLTVPLADALIEAVELRAGSRVLDVATGTGHVAIAAARRFTDVVAVDYVPALLETARRRAAAEGLAVDFREADAEALPFPDASVDHVLSAIGVMFTSDHARAAAELVRVCRPGEHIAVANWTPVRLHRPDARDRRAARPAARRGAAPTRWGTEETMRELLGDGVSDLRFTTLTVAQRFLSPEHFADFFLSHYGPDVHGGEAPRRRRPACAARRPDRARGRVDPRRRRHAGARPGVARDGGDAGLT